PQDGRGLLRQAGVLQNRPQPVEHVRRLRQGHRLPCQRLQRRRVARPRRLPQPPPPRAVVRAPAHPPPTAPAPPPPPPPFPPSPPLTSPPRTPPRQRGFANARAPPPRGTLRRRRRCNIEPVGGARVIGEGRRIPPVRPGEIEQLPFLAFRQPQADLVQLGQHPR